ncbi:hypothetical protein [Sporolactobacillus pectinivorans]|uniref:hypothetical protein n=1 Tax=Sporolactobacillus pectinivorans TaxID=1591408 RepID=UPI000C25D672|nr:hypothetical protein [Sporolactobacillus pectinivorans]
MTVEPENVKLYLEDPSKAILDAENGLCSESEVQLIIDDVYKHLDPSYKELGSFQKLIFGWSMSAPKMLMSQNYLDEVLKPFIKKVNSELNWQLRAPADFMK